MDCKLWRLCTYGGGIVRILPVATCVGARVFGVRYGGAFCRGAMSEGNELSESQINKGDTVAALAAIALLAFILTSSSCLAASSDAAAPAPTPDRTAIDACSAAAQPDIDAIDIPDIAARLKKPDSRIEDKDWSGQDLSGKDLSGKALINMKLKKAILRGADLTDAIICGGDLSDADLTGAHLDRAVIAAGTDVNGANFTKASARKANIADVSGAIRLDGADLREASTLCDELPRCIGGRIEFSSVNGADFRGASVESLCCAVPGLATARLDGVTTHFDIALDEDTEGDLEPLASGVGEAGRITFLSAYGYSGTQTEFSGHELRELAALLKQMAPASAHPSFDCSRAATEVEKAVCADPKLAALDAALNWLWQRVPHTPQEIEAQKKWAASRATCPPQNYGSSPDAILFASSSALYRCIGTAYAERIRALGPKSSLAAVDGGRYTTDAPLELPQGPSSGLARKFIMARGYRNDELNLKNWGKGDGKITGDGLFANYHVCELEATEAETQRTGSKIRIDDDPKAPDDQYSISFVITPQVIVRAGGARQFQCGVRGGWSDIYYRQPDDLISRASPLPEAR